MNELPMTVYVARKTDQKNDDNLRLSTFKNHIEHAQLARDYGGRWARQ